MSRAAWLPRHWRWALAFRIFRKVLPSHCLSISAGGAAAERFWGAQILMPWLLSFAAGAMVYVVVAELIPQAQGRRGTLGFAAGFLLMMVLDIALG